MKKNILVLLILALVFSPAFAAGAKEATVQVSEEKVEGSLYPLSLEIYDASGNSVTEVYEKTPQRVVSTQLSMTELLIKLGLSDKIVGIIDPDNKVKGENGEIISTFKSVGRKGAFSKEAILAVEPDIVLGKAPLMFTDNAIGTVEYYNNMGIDVYTELASASIANQSLDNIISDIRNIGKIFNVEDKANAYADELENKLNEVVKNVSGKATGEKLRVILMAMYKDGSFVNFASPLHSAMLEVVNAENVSQKGGTGLTLENLIALNPDAIVYVKSDRAAKTDAVAVDSLLSNETIQSVPAIKNKKILEIDYDDIMDFGARDIEAVEKLYTFLYE